MDKYTTNFRVKQKTVILKNVEILLKHCLVNEALNSLLEKLELTDEDTKMSIREKIDRL